MEEPHPEDLAYFAAFMDGEGCFRVHGKGSKSTACVSAKNTYPRTLREMARLFGGKVRAKKTEGKRKQAYEWEAYGPVALEVCRLLLLPRASDGKPRLREKQRQAELLLEWAKWPRKSQRAAEIALEISNLKRIVYAPHNPS
jgi:hypothetical protein